MPRRSTVSETITPAPCELAPLEAFAVAKAVSEKTLKELRPRLQVGDGQAVDVTLRIHGALNVAGESSQTTSEKPPCDLVLAAVLGGLTKRARAIVREHVQKLFSAWTAGDELPEVEPQLTDCADDLLQSIARHVTKAKRGNVVASLAVERISASGSGLGGQGTNKRRAA